MKNRFLTRFKVSKSPRRYIGDGEACFVVAEAGVNHNGKLALAKKLVDAAVRAEADAIKFQTFVTEKLVNRNLSRRQYGMLKMLEMDEASFLELRGYAKQNKIILFSTPFDDESLSVLRKLDMPLYKISSGDLDNLPLLRRVARVGKPMIVSTGMSTMSEISEAVATVGHFCDRLVLAHCTSLYPPRFDEVNLKAISTIRKAFGVPVGYSDHSLGYEVSIAAVALGACLIEKHLTLDKKMAGPDHKASLEPSEFGKMVKMIRNVERALGVEVKKPVPREQDMRSYARKSITAISDMASGVQITKDDVAILRPGGGMRPKHLDAIIGRRTRVRIRKGWQIKSAMLQ